VKNEIWETNYGAMLMHLLLAVTVTVPILLEVCAQLSAV